MTTHILFFDAGSQADESSRRTSSQSSIQHDSNRSACRCPSRGAKIRPHRHAYRRECQKVSSGRFCRMPPLAKTYMILAKAGAGERRTHRRGFKDEAFNSLQLNNTVVPISKRKQRPRLSIWDFT